MYLRKAAKARLAKYKEVAALTRKKVTLEVTGDAAPALAKLLAAVRLTCGWGAGTEVFIQTGNEVAPVPVSGFDGDGSDFIVSMEIDGTAVDFDSIIKENKWGTYKDKDGYHSGLEELSVIERNTKGIYKPFVPERIDYKRILERHERTDNS